MALQELSSPHQSLHGGLPPCEGLAMAAGKPLSAAVPSPPKAGPNWAELGRSC